MKFSLAFALCFTLYAAPALADDLFHNQTWANVASDRKASRVGDVLTVVVYQSAEARNAARNEAHKNRNFDGSLQTSSTSESAHLALNGAYSGQGEVRRSESFVTAISATIDSILPNGDFEISGRQAMNINGERTLIRVRGRIRPTDISADNQVLSTRIADAEINYDGRGFATRNARPGVVHRLLSLLGLSG